MSKHKGLYRKTRRLIVRPLELSDYEAWKATELNRLPARNVWDRGPSTQAQANKITFRKIVKNLDRLRKKGVFFDFAVFDKSGTLIGTVGIMEVSRGISHTAFLGYRLYNRHWGKGYAKEAVKAGIDIAFRDLKLHRLEAGIEPRNRRSIALAKSLKMRGEGLKKRALFLRNKWVDLLMFTLTTEDVGISFDSSVFKNWKPRH